MKKYLYIFIPLLLFFILSSDVFAKDINEIQFKFDYIEDVKQQIAEHSEKWMAHIKKVALNLFYILAGISFISKFILDVMSKGEIDAKESISFIVKFIITTGFFYYLLDNGVALAQSITTGFTQLATDAAGGRPKYNKLIALGFDLLKAGEHISWHDWEIKFIHFVMSVLTLVFLMIMSANLVIEEIAAAIMIYAGFFVLALGGMDYTRESAVNFFKAVLGISLKILTIILIMTITVGIIDSVTKNFNLNSGKAVLGDLIIYYDLVAFLTVFFLTLLSLKIPDAVSNLVSSAWGNMSGLTLMGGVALATNIAQKTANAVNSTFRGAKNAHAGYKDYKKNKEIGQKKKEAESRGEDTSLNPIFNKQKNASGGAYYGGKAVAAGADAFGSVSKKLSNVFGNSKEMSDTVPNNNQDQSGNSNAANDDTPKTNDKPNNDKSS